MVPRRRWAGKQARRHAGTRARKRASTSAQAHKHAGTRARRHGGTQARKHASRQASKQANTATPTLPKRAKTAPQKIEQSLVLQKGSQLVPGWVEVAALSAVSSPEFTPSGGGYPVHRKTVRETQMFVSMIHCNRTSRLYMTTCTVHRRLPPECLATSTSPLRAKCGADPHRQPWRRTKT